MNDKEMRAALSRMDHIFGAIKTAGILIAAIEPQRLLDSWNRQEEVLPFTDPTLMQQLLLHRDDMARKKRLLTAARDFMVVWNAVKEESIAAEAKALAADPRSRRPRPGRGYDEEDAQGNEEGA